ncbi:hypothetical protein UFOVP1516_7 [uncultured Caudovirales phage]|uniref:Uncharacterized protein n=1 Tax=uncultured Caudovirales phage TaxID=2100421 RepID=A0A6J7X7A3_9CAUD|nr:hypothetical protein UFOVP887_37 [uncultured Caudovirales phage]CAB5226681.1 hypothetical protein UFOVP1516_7 [uncultured Caudovirales phage]
MPNITNIHNFKVVPKSNTSFEETEPTLDADMVLNAAVGELKEVLLIGQTINGELYVASTTGEKKALLYWIEDFKMRLMTGTYDDE